MKKCLGIVLLAFCMVLPSFAKQRIDMKGRRDTSKRSIPKDLPIQAFIEESVKELSLEFTSDLGMVYVSVSDFHGNIVYTEIIEAVSNIPINFSLDKELEGEFILTLSNEGNEMSGKFSLSN